MRACPSCVASSSPRHPAAASDSGSNRLGPEGDPSGKARAETGQAEDRAMAVNALIRIGDVR